MSVALRRELTRVAVEVGAILNVIEDDDERELMQAHFETVLNGELFAGSVNRADAPSHGARIWNLIEARRARSVADRNVVDIFSRRVPKGAA